MNSFYKQLMFIVLGVAIIATGVLVAVAVNNRGVPPVLHLRLDEGYGASAYDSSGNTNTGTITNVAWKNEPECKTGKCLFFDGVGDYITISDSSELSPIRGVTVQTWVRPNNFDSTASLILKDTQYSLDIAQGVPNFRAYVNGLWQSAIGTARAWLFRESFDNQLTGDTATFTEAFGYRALGPSSLTSENGILITDADGTGSGTGDDLQYTRGSQSTPDGTSYTFENFNPNQGTLEFWVRPNFDGDDSVRHEIFHIESGDYFQLLKHSDNTLSFFYNSGMDTVATSVNSTNFPAGEWRHVVVTWSENETVYGSNYVELYLDGSPEDGETTVPNITSVRAGMTIGWRYNVPGTTFNGTIFGRILNRPLTSSEVTALYNSGAGHTDTFTVTPDTVWMGTYSDSTTTAAYWHTGKSVSAIADGTDEDTLTTASGADNSFSNNDRIVVYDGTGYKIEGCVDGTPTDTTVLIDNCSNADAGATENVGLSLDFALTYDADAADNTVHQVTTEDFGIAAWVKVDSDASTLMYIANKEAATAGYGLVVRAHVDGTVRLWLGDGTDELTVTGATDIRDDKWHHIAVVIDRNASSTTQIYIDGYMEATTSVGALASIDSITTTGILALGAQTGGGYKFDGQIRDVLIAYPADIMAANELGASGEILTLATNPRDLSTVNSEDTWTLNDNAANTTVVGANNNLTASANTNTFSSQQAFVSKNLIADPGMENGGIGGWASGTTLTLTKSTTSVKFDTQSISVVNAGTQRTSQDFQVAAGEDYVWSLWYLTPTSGDDAYIRVYDVTNAAILFSEDLPESAGNWQFYETAFEVPAGSTSIRLYLYAYSSPDTLYYDQIQLLPNLVDNGGMESWQGTDPDIPTGWTNNGIDVGEMASSTTAHSGSVSAKFISADIGEGIYQSGVSLDTSKYYTLSFWGRADAGTVDLFANFAESGNTTSNRIDVTMDTTYRKYSVTGKATNASVYVRLYITTSENQTFYIDDVSLIELDTAPASTVTPSTQANSFGTGKWGDTNGAFLVDGGDSLTYPTSGNINAASGTIAFWIKPNGWDGDDGVQHQFFDTDADRLILLKSPNNKFELYPNGTDSTGRYLVSTSALTSSDIGANTWAHIVVTWDNSADELLMYLDGSAHTTNSVGSTWTLPSYGTNIHLGTRSTDDLVQADAFFDDIRIYDTVLSASEILAIYNDTNPTTITANQWSHVTGVYSRDDNDIKTYVNGVLQTTYNVGSNYKLGTSTNSITIGDEFTGYLDDIKIYDEPRTASQIRTDYVSSMTTRGASGRAVTIGEGQDPSEGLIAHWTFDETALNACGINTDACDSSGMSNNLTAIADAAPTSTAKYGYAATFDGTGDYYCSDPDDDGVCEDDDDLDMGTGDFTIQAWVKTDTKAKYIVNKRPDSSTGYTVYVEGTGGMFGGKIGDSSDTYQVNGTTDITDGFWHHMAFVVDKDKEAYIYLDGKDDSGSRTGTLADVGDLSNTANFEVGFYSGGSFNGQIDDIKIYKTARSASQIRKDYETGPPPVAHWKFDENATSTAYDTAGSNDGRLVNMATSTNGGWTTGKFGSALSFDGVDDYVEVSDTTSIQNVFDGGGSITAWINPRSDGESDTGRIVDKRTSPNGWIFFVAQESAGNVKLEFFSERSTDGRWETTAQIPINQFTHVAVVYDANSIANNPLLYVNGVSQSVTETGTPNGDRVSDSGVNLGIGDELYGNTASFNGIIDDIRIYNYARTQKQIMQDMNAGHPAVGSPVGSYVGYWKFDEGYASTSYDMSISQNNGTLTGGVAWTQAGKFGGALSFDGINDYVEVSDSDSLDEIQTISLWFSSISSASAFNRYLFSKTATNDYKNSLTYKESLQTVVLYDSGGSLIVSSDTLTTNQWHHIVMSIDGTDVSLYIDGLLDGTGTYSAANPFDNSSNVLIGGGDANRFFTGIIDEVKIYPFALTPEEVKLEYNSGATLKLGSLSAPPTGGAGFGTSTDSASIAYCVPGGTDQCDPPVAHWKFDEKSGDTAYDISGANDGDLQGTCPGASTCPTWQSARACHTGACLSFDGSDDYVDAGGSNDIDSITGDLTISTWINISQSKDSEAVSTGNGLNDFTRPYSIFIADSTNAVSLRMGNGVAQFVAQSGSLNLNTWYHVVGTISGNNMNIYVNGASSGTDTFSGTRQTGTKVTFGAYDTAGSRSFNGSIDDVRIYNYARTPAQIAWEYNRGAPIGHWTMDYVGYATAASSTIYDSSANSNDGTFYGEIMNNGTTTASTLPTWTSASYCKYGACLDFDGVDDYVDVGTSMDMQDWTAVSACSWVNYDSSGTKEHTIISNYSATTGSILVRLEPSDDTVEAFVVTVGDTTTGGGFADLILTPNNWHHICMTYNKVALKAYLDGVESSTTYADSDDLDTDASVSLNIGVSPHAANDVLTGSIDEVRIYNTALTATQVQALYLNNDRSAGASLEGNLVGEWRFDEGTGSEMADTHYQRYGKFNYAMEFDGVDDYVSVSDNPFDFGASTDFTINFWIKSSNSGNKVRVVDKSKAGTIPYEGYGCTIQTTDLMVCTLDDGPDTANVTSLTDVVDGSWHSIILVADRDDNLSLYIDGILEDSSSLSAIGDIDNSESLWFGRSNDYDGQYFNGQIDDVRIYNYALTPTQIRNVYNQNSAVRFGPLEGLP